MKFFDISSVGETGGMDVYCFAKGHPKELGFKKYYLSEGLEVLPHYPKDPFDASVHLHSKYSGIKLGSLIGNKSGGLMLHKDVIKIVQQHKTGSIEVLPFTLYNHKGRVHSKDYAFLNPLTIIDCLNMDLSGAEYDEEDEDNPYSFKKIILDTSKLIDVPDIFRIKWVPECYVWSETLIAALRTKDFTNIEVTEYEQG